MEKTEQTISMLEDEMFGPLSSTERRTLFTLLTALFAQPSEFA